MNGDQQTIRELAYRLWEQRGRPEGCPDDDWFAAERQLSGSEKAKSRMVDEAMKESFPSSDPPATGLPDNPPANADEKWAAAGNAKRSRKKGAKSGKSESDPPPRYVARDALGEDVNR